MGPLPYATRTDPCNKAVPGQESADPLDWIIGQAGEHVGQPSLRIDHVQLAS